MVGLLMAHERANIMSVAIKILLLIISTNSLIGKQYVIHRTLTELSSVHKVNNRNLLNIYVFFSETHRRLFDLYFLPTLSKVEKDYALFVYHVEQLTKDGAFLSPGWNQTMLNKNKIIIEAIRENYGGAILYSDIDIQFLQPIKKRLFSLLDRNDLVVQQNAPSGKSTVCAGFVFLRCNEKTSKLYRTIYQAMLADPSLRDQVALNRFLRSNQTSLVWQYLPNEEFYNPQKLWSFGDTLNVSKSIRVHHANWTSGVDEKIAQFEYVRQQLRYKN